MCEWVCQDIWEYLILYHIENLIFLVEIEYRSIQCLLLPQEQNMENLVDVGFINLSQIDKVLWL